MKRIIATVLGICVAVPALTFSLATPDRDGVPRAGAASHGDLIVHEWGTFTSIYGSDGTLLPGIERDEEALPPFVYSHDIAPGRTQFAALTSPPPNGSPQFIQVLTKGFRRPVHNVTVKMETPVLYFYSPERIDARVSVGFRGGSISQWYPARSGGEWMPQQWRKNEEGRNEVVPIDFAEPYDGSIEWEFTIEPRTPDTDFDVMKPDERPNWIHPRAPRSNLLRTANGETETYLFYRGLGNFEQPIRYRVDGQTLTVESEGDLPYLLVLDLESADTGRVLWKGTPRPRESIDLGDFESGSVRDEVYDSLRGALVEAGLYPDEASAMLRTWWQSYFGSPGLRAFWIVPRAFTDEILPIEVEPAPRRIERVLLGRSEILTPELEERLFTQFAKEPEENAFRSSRYYPAYQARVEQMKRSAKRQGTKKAGGLPPALSNGFNTRSTDQ